MFIGKRIVLHGIDEATRFSEAWEIPNKEPRSIITAFNRGRFRRHGAPDEIVSDAEGGLVGEAWGRWCD